MKSTKVNFTQEKFKEDYFKDAGGLGVLERMGEVRFFRVSIFVLVRLEYIKGGAG